MRLATIDDALAEARRIAAAGKATTLGNWTCGQILNHVATWAEFAFTDSGIRPPWILRLMGPMLLKRFLKKGLPAGHSIPKVPGGTLGIEVVPAAQALARFEKAFQRLKREAPKGRHAFFGAMKHDQWIALNLRHCELHMSFVMV